ncbi:hypothetical protein QAD02_010748 [Eretmocerus hayati]|uniref:Uncharacterized protein n=1 Tax=Eretmocerus hayati TaxID=131215 RepID=A0ACC2NV07_9HYME|nr:hypothetical protein QAD02_010748 [Eretmocerus hayati]
MAWGYWSATSVHDRGRSPRRDKERLQLHAASTEAVGYYHQQQQPQRSQPLQPQSLPTSLAQASESSSSSTGIEGNQTQVLLHHSADHQQQPQQASTAGISETSTLGGGGCAQGVRLWVDSGVISGAVAVPLVPKLRFIVARNGNDLAGVACGGFPELASFLLCHASQICVTVLF